LDERKHTFQLDLLLELQDVLQRQMRATAKVLLQDQTTLRERGSLFQLPTELDRDSYDTGVELSRLRVRVLDQELRDDLEAFHDFTSGLEVSGVVLKDVPVEDARRLEAHMRDLGDRYLAVNITLRALVRSELGRSPDPSLTRA
jgi:hypothetical protein